MSVWYVSSQISELSNSSHAAVNPVETLCIITNRFTYSCKQNQPLKDLLFVN